MNCRNCGAAIVPGENFCRNCGASVALNNEQVGASPTMNQTVQPNPQMNQPSQPVMQPNNQYNQYTQPMMQQPQKKNNTGIIVLVAVIVVAVVVIGAVILFTGKGKGKDNNNSNSNSNTVESNSNSNPVTPVSTQVTKVRYKGFEFSIPVDYLFEIQTSTLLVTDDITWASTVEVVDGSYTTIKSRKEQLKLNAEKTGYTAGTPAVKNYGGIEWVTMEVSLNSSNAIIAYTHGTATKLIGVVAYTKNNTYDYSILEKLGPIFKSSTYVGESQSISTNTFSSVLSSKLIK